MPERDLDIVLYGATGFVGALTAARLARHADGGVRIALAGRSRAKLEALRTELGGVADSWELAVVDATDLAGLRALAGRTRVLATTVGPYVTYGKDVARACAEQGTHYADLTGEVLFVRWSMDELDTVARATGAVVVHACGFDSIPSDLGVLITAARAAADGQGTLAETTLLVRSLKGAPSGGTVDSMRQQAIAARTDPTARRALGDPYALSPRRSEEPSSGRRPSSGIGGRLRRLVPVDRDPATGRWTGPFLMASFNTRVVRLSNTLSGWSYGRDLRYREVTDFGSGPMSPVMAGGMALGLGGLVAGLSWTPTRTVLDRFLPKPGEGPGAQTLAAGRFRFEIRTTTTTGARYRTRVGADLDPGYGGTAVMFGESILALALDEGLPLRAGVCTPATGLGVAVVDRLRAHGFTFEVERADTDDDIAAARANTSTDVSSATNRRS
jgi:short subunit dehydrogenase-like uncharacterized protein